MNAFLISLPFVLFGAMLACVEGGRRLGLRQEAEAQEEARGGLASMEGAVFALFGLLLAFSFSGAAGRLDARRDLILAESNAVGTFWLRTDLLPEPARAGVQETARGYIDARIALYHPDADVPAGLAEVAKRQERLWKETFAACQAAPDQRASMLVLPALNDLLDLATARVAATFNHPPVGVLILLVGMALACAVLAGWRLARAKQAHTIHRLVFAAMVSLTVWVTLDLEFPRRGLIRVESTDQLLVDARAAMR